MGDYSLHRNVKWEECVIMYKTIKLCTNSERIAYATQDVLKSINTF